MTSNYGSFQMLSNSNIQFRVIKSVKKEAQNNPFYFKNLVNKEAKKQVIKNKSTVNPKKYYK